MSASIFKMCRDGFDRLPSFVRHFLGRRVMDFRHGKKWLLFQLVDRLALSFVRRGHSHAVLVVKNDALGDYLLFRNYLASLRAHPAYQDKPLVLCGNIAVRDLAEAYDSGTVDRFIWLDPRAFLHRPFYRFRILRKVKRLGANVALNPSALRGLMDTDALIRASGAAERIGCAVATWGSLWSPRFGWIYGKSLWEQKVSRASYTRRLPFEQFRFEFYRTHDFFREVLGSTSLPERPHLTPVLVDLPELPPHFLTILPGAGEPSREWPAERFGQVARHLHQRHGWALVIAGTGADHSKVQTIAQNAGIVPLDLTGRLTLPQLVALLARSSLVLANDSGGIHLTAALDRFGIAIASRNSSFVLFHPYPPELCKTVRYVYPPSPRVFHSMVEEAHETWLHPEWLVTAAQVTTTDVIAAADQLLAERHKTDD